MVSPDSSEHVSSLPLLPQHLTRPPVRLTNHINQLQRQLHNNQDLKEEFWSVLTVGLKNFDWRTTWVNYQNAEPWGYPEQGNWDGKLGKFRLPLALCDNEVCQKFFIRQNLLGYSLGLNFLWVSDSTNIERVICFYIIFPFLYLRDHSAQPP